jgi:hypothetical protein
MSMPTPETDAFALPTRGLGTGYYQVLDFAREFELQRDAAREDERRLAADLRTIQKVINDNESVFGYCTIGNKSLAAHEALTATKA